MSTSRLLLGARPYVERFAQALIAKRDPDVEGTPKKADIALR
jgi:hypothetical protein